MNSLTKVGMIGAGTIAEALTIGLSAFDDQRAEIFFSPRNEAVSHRLALRFSNVHVAADNQAVVDAADIIILAVRPQIAAEVLAALRFRPDQQIVSLIAAFSVEQIAALVTPAHNISRAVPLPPVAERQGPFALYTQSPEVAHLFHGLGTIIRIDNETHLNLVSAATSLMGTYFGMAGAVDRWLIDRGFPSAASRAFVGELLLNLAVAARTRPDATFATLNRDYSTPGGLNEQAWRELQAIGWPNDLQAALDLVLKRIYGQATADSQLPRR